MKKIFYLVMSLLLVGGVTTSCDDLLEEKSHMEIDKNEFMNNAQEAEQVLLGTYRALVTNGCYGYHLSLLFNISTDLAQCEGSSTERFRAIPTNFFNQTHAEIETTWADLYFAVYTANDFLSGIQKHLDSYSVEDRKLAEIYMGEARALRALCYFELVRWWGHVPLLKTPEDSLKPADTYEQADPKDVYAFIEEDLKYAIDVLPWWDEDPRKAPEYRLTKASAAGLLTRVYATWAGFPLKDESKWAEAAKMAELVIKSNKHSLLPEYRDVWNNTCNGIWAPKESLIEVSFYSPTYVGQSSPAGRIGKWNGVKGRNKAGINNAGNWKVLYPFMRKWMNWQISKGGSYEKPIDLRYELSIADYMYSNGDKNYYTKISKDKEPIDRKTYFNMPDGAPEDISDDPKVQGQINDLKFACQIFTPRKWDTGEYVKDGLVNNDYSNINWYIMRYSDLLLLYAEAVNESQGPTASAVEALNRVRRRGFGQDQNSPNSAIDTPASVSQEELRQIIRDERAYELCFEGQRRQDLIRWGIYYETIKNTGKEVWTWYPRGVNGHRGGNYTVFDYTTLGKNELFPIPLRELDIMPRLKQNPGW